MNDERTRYTIGGDNVSYSHAARALEVVHTTPTHNILDE
jgi:hypothetical protein